MATLPELPNQGQAGFVYYTCNHCEIRIETRHHCTVCDDYDLCVSCYQRLGHSHQMEKIGFELNNGAGASRSGQHQTLSLEAKRLSIQRCIRSLSHACQCRDQNCRLPSCHKMKRVLVHMKLCKRKTNGGCTVCKHLIALYCYHAKRCQETRCPVPCCANVKRKLREHQQRSQQRLQANQLLRPAMQATVTPMGRSSNTTPGPSTSATVTEHSRSGTAPQQIANVAKEIIDQQGQSCSTNTNKKLYEDELDSGEETERIIMSSDSESDI